MWLLFIQITAGIIAAIRGWGALPILILIGMVVSGFIIGALFGDDAICIMSVIDWAVSISFVIMAVIGKKKSEILPANSTSDLSTSDRIKCPTCAELILPDAKICRFCGYKLKDE